MVRAEGFGDVGWVRESAVVEWKWEIEDDGEKRRYGC